MYFIGTLRLLDGVVDDFRCIGYERHYSPAHKKVMDNACDMFEDGYYQYAVIIEIRAGLYPSQREIQWFERYRDGGIATVEQPQVPDTWYPYVVG